MHEADFKECFREVVTPKLRPKQVEQKERRVCAKIGTISTAGRLLALRVCFQPWCDPWHHNGLPSTTQNNS